MRTLLGGIALWLAGCTLSTDVDRFRFTESVCPPVDACTGGTTHWYVLYQGDVPEVEGGTIAGFNLDGTSEAVCRHDDLQAPDGTLGIDNRLAPLLSILEAGDPDVDFGELILQGYLSGDGLALLEVRNVDDFANDDCVSIRLRLGFVPEGVTDPPAYLDADGDRELDDDLTLDFGIATTTDDTACITDGLLQAEPSDGRVIIPLGEANIELGATHSRIQGEISETHVRNLWQGGALNVEEIVSLLEDDPGSRTIAQILRREADLSPDSDGICRGLSSGLVFEAKAAMPGSLRER